tara:strand:- start:332 stop:691 length:360 start_codon:yes stop_codon:yes gene_type:complete
MFGTCIAVFDGYARSTNECIRLVKNNSNNKNFYNIIIWILIVGSVFIIYFFGSKLKQLVDLATTISFLIAPFVAIANYLLVTKHIDINMRPKKWLKILAMMGIVYLVVFSILFIYLKLF